MTVELYISGVLVESILVNFEGCVCYEQKWARVKAISDYYKYHYRRSIEMLDNWEIVAVKGSGVNKI